MRSVAAICYGRVIVGECSHCRSKKKSKGSYSVDTAVSADEKEIALECVENAYVENPTVASAAKEEALAVENPVAAECEGEKTATLDDAETGEPFVAPETEKETPLV